METDNKLVFYLEGSRRISNIFWALTVTLGGLGFFLTGLSSFFKTNFLFITQSNEISFLPQGIVLTFYGTVGFIIGIFLCLTVVWDIGFGYNEYNKVTKQLTLYRKGFPGKNRELVLLFPFKDIKSIKLQIIEGLNPKRQLFIRLTDNREIPVSGVGRPIPLKIMEEEAIMIAKYLNVFLETE
jgi:hypothetical protein